MALYLKIHLVWSSIHNIIISRASFFWHVKIGRKKDHKCKEYIGNWEIKCYNNTPVYVSDWWNHLQRDWWNTLWVSIETTPGKWYNSMKSIDLLLLLVVLRLLQRYFEGFSTCCYRQRMSSVSQKVKEQTAQRPHIAGLSSMRC